MGRTVILGGSEIHHPERIRSLLRKDDCYVCCDSGLKHCEALGVQPNLIVGDFDSWDNPGLPVETIVLPREKDDTDTFFGARTMFKRGARDFLLLGVVGGRLDHTLANVALLRWLAQNGCHAEAADDYSVMEIVFPGTTALVPDQWSFFSLLSLTETARGVTIRNAKYLLDNAVISCDYPYAVSNEPLPGQIAEISLKEGCLLIIRDW